MERDYVVMLDGRRIPVGTMVVFPPGTLARDKTAWADPNEFKPERFLASHGGEGLSLLAAAGSAGEIKMMPFRAGRRMCPGMGVALLHMAYFMANLVSREGVRVEGGLGGSCRRSPAVRRVLHCHEAAAACSPCPSFRREDKRMS